MPDAHASHDLPAEPAAVPESESTDRPPGVRDDRASEALRDRLRLAIERASARTGSAHLPEAIAAVVVGAVAGTRGGLVDLARDSFALGGVAGSDLAGELAMHADRRGAVIDQDFAQRHGDQPLARGARSLAEDLVHQAPMIAAERAGGPLAEVVAEGALQVGDAYADARAAGADHQQARQDGFARIVELLRPRRLERDGLDSDPRPSAEP